jgi:hypothetical protein
MLFIIKSCVKCIYHFQKYNKILCSPKIDPKKNNDIESCDDTDSEDNGQQYENTTESIVFYNFIYITYCELYKYMLTFTLILMYIFIFYIIYDLYRS